MVECAVALQCSLGDIRALDDNELATLVDILRVRAGK
jgi:hypothetical protein